MSVQEKMFRTPSGRIYYKVSRVQDSRPWLVFLPGLTADNRLFRRQMEYFEGRVNYLAWDPPAHGLSRPFRLDFNMEDLARWLNEIFAAEHVHAPVLVGQSLGGYVAQVWMALCPDEASGFVSIDSCSLKRKYYTGAELWMLRHTGWIYRCLPWRLIRSCAVNGNSVSPEGREIMRRIMEGYDKPEYCALADHGSRIFAEAVEAGNAGELRCPVQLICGKRDSSGSAVRYNRRWAAEENHPIEWIPDAGHNANADQPDEVNRIIAEFIR